MYDIIVIGGGPAGLTAALYALRADKRVLVLEGTGFGGQIVYTHAVENFPGIRRISGAEFADALLDQVMAAGGDVEFDSVTGIKDGDVKTVITETTEYTARAVIVATGVKHRLLGIDGESELAGNGISFCAVCDGAFYNGKRVAVVGGGNAAVEDAMYLADIAEKVYIVHRRREFRAEERLVRMMKSRENIEPVLSSTVSRLLEENGLAGAEVTNSENGEKRILVIDGLFVAVGQIPQNGIFEGLLKLDKDGYISAGEDCRTNVRGIFAAGDCRTKAVRQLTTAAADGASAAIAACEYIQEAE